MTRPHVGSVVLLILTVTAPAAAQTPQPATPVSQQAAPAGQVTATVTAPAPVHDFPLGLLPIRTLEVGTVVIVLGQNDDWWMVEFDYPQFGRHVGWIRKNLLTVPSASAVPVVAQQQARPTPTLPPGGAVPPAIGQPAAVSTKAAAPANPSPLVFRGFFSFDMTSLFASETYNALLGSSAVASLGGGAEIGGIGKGFFVRFGVSQTSDTGERALLIDGTPVSVGIPITIRMMPIEMTAGWRHTPAKKAQPGAPGPAGHAPYSIYGGGGLLLLRYSEVSDFAEPDDNLEDTFPGFVAYGGLSVDLGRWIFLSGEGGFRSVPNAIGAGGLSAEVGETNLGGAVVRVMVGIRSRK